MIFCIWASEAPCCITITSISYKPRTTDLRFVRFISNRATGPSAGAPDLVFRRIFHAVLLNPPHLVDDPLEKCVSLHPPSTDRCCVK